jgi:hypothetical protein
MIENYRSGLFWKLFMQSPEAQRARKRIEEAKGANGENSANGKG